jgi:hypothetical protein
MPTFEEYINSLEGQTDVDPLRIARDLNAIYNDEIGIRDAKITELTGTITERDGALTVAADDLRAQKAKNFDLAMQIPSGTNLPTDTSVGESEVDPSTVTIDDLFVS